MAGTAPIACCDAGVEVGALATPGDEVSLSGCCMSGF
jgi:hypothetical protein